MSGSSIVPVGRAAEHWTNRAGREAPDGALFEARARATQAGQAGQLPARSAAPQNAAPQSVAPQSAGPSAADVALDLTQLTLDVAGIFDPTPISDGSNAVISLLRGDWSGAAISGVSMIPYLGDTAKLAKLPRLAETLGKVADLVRANPAAAAALRGPLEKLGEVLNKAPIDSLPEAVRGPVQTLKGKFDEAMSAIRSSETPASQVPASQQPAVPAGAADGANGGGPATGAGDGSAGAKGSGDGSPPTATGGAGGGNGTGGTGGVEGSDVPDPEGLAYRADLPKHLSGPDGFKGGQLHGTHNQQTAIAELNGRGATYSLKPTSTPGISELEYKVVNPNTGKLVEGRKTVYDPTVYSDQQVLDMAQQAGKRAFEAHQANPAQKSFDVTEGGVNFRVYINNDKTTNAPFVGNVHPIG